MPTTLRIHLTPRSARDEVLGWEGEVLRARVTAPPVEGRANEALLRLLAEALGVPKGSLRIARGERCAGCSWFDGLTTSGSRKPLTLSLSKGGRRLELRTPSLKAPGHRL